MKHIRKNIFLAIIITLLLPAYSFAVPKLMRSTETNSSAARDVAPRATPPETQPATQPATPPETQQTQPVNQPVSKGGHIYIAESGSATTDGASCSTAHPVSWLNTPSNWGNGDKQVGAGDTVHLCGVISQRVLILGSGASGSPITIKFEPGAKFSSEAWDATYGALYAKDRQDIIVDGAGGKIENTANGTTLSKQVASVGLIFHNGQNIEVKNLIVSNLYKRTPGSSDPNDFGTGIAFTGKSVNSSVHDCMIDNAKYGIYISYAGGVTSSNINIQNNTLTKTSTGIVVGSGNINAIANNVSISNNVIYGNDIWDGSWITAKGQTVWHHSDGIHIWAAHTGTAINGLNIYNNEIGPNLGTHTSGWIYVGGYSATVTSITNLNIYNNILTASGTGYPSLAYIALNWMPTAGIKIYNNTIAASGLGMGIYLASGAVVDDIRNNIFSKTRYPMYLSSGTKVNSCDRNLYYGLTSLWFYNQTGFISFAQWQSVLGFDKNAVTADPLLSPTYHPAATSPARGKGENLGGIFVKDKAGVTRPAGAWTLGAYQ